MPRIRQRMNSREREHNTVIYELYTSKPPDDQLIQKYKEHSPSLDIKRQEGSVNMCHGNLDFQNSEDEWLVVYLLYKLSEFDHDLVIKLYDDDGDILLIEAAEHLPSWLESSKSNNRVFIHAGRLHIIPEHIDLEDLQKDPLATTITQAASKFIRDMNETKCGHSNQYPPHYIVKTKADRAIQDAIMEQLSGMPDKEAWLSKKYRQLAEIITENTVQSVDHLGKKFKETLSLSAVMAMRDEDLMISPISSISSSSDSSSSWSTEQDDNP